MAYLLNLETATRNCSVSLAKDGVTLALCEVAEEGYSHAEKLHVFIEQALLESNIKFADLNAVAVSRGPGSYTGLRIGVSAAKGLCYALNIPLIAVDTLTTLAARANVADGLIVPMIDARRMEVYSAIFDSNLNPIRSVEAQIITTESFREYNEELYFIGDSTAKCKEVLMGANRHFIEDIVFPSSSEMSNLSYQKFLLGQFEDVAYFEPYYLKDFMTAPPKR